MRVGLIVALGMITALLDVLLCLTLLGQVMRADGAGLLAWAATLVMSGCFLVAVSIVLLHCASDWGWCRPGWALGAFYLLLVAEELWDRSGAYGSPAPLVIVCAYLTTIPYQLAVWARHEARRPLRRQPERPYVPWPHTVRRVFDRPFQQGVPLQDSRSATLAEESPSVQGWNSVANRR